VIGQQKANAMTRNITANDIRDLLAGFAAAIELDQIRVDALPASRFHHLYDDSLWRMWRRDHLQYINLLLSTADAIPAVILEKLTWMATHYQPEIVSEAARELFALAAGESYPRGDVATTTAFLERLIEDVVNRSERQSIGEDAPALMRSWLLITDPLRIAQDPECGYGLVSGSVN
jgi:hypothetical protein